MRRPLLCIGCVAIVAAAILVSARFSVGEPSAASAPAARSFHFTYWARLPAPAAGSKQLEAWIPVPREDDLQRVADFTVEASVPYTVETEPEYGNKMVHVRVAEPRAEVAIAWSATITRTEDRGQGRAAANPRFLQADKSIPLDGTAASLAAELHVKGGDRPVAERAKSIYGHVLGTMVYDKVVEGWGQGDFERACKVGKGNCTDFHAKFIGIARASAIPARFTMGFPLPKDPKGTVAGYHCWAHFQDGEAWVPVDISEAQKIVARDPAKAEWFFGHLDPDRVAMTVGRDLTLAPKQAGGPLAHFAYPYVEVDGKGVDLPKEARGWTYEDVAK